MALPDNHPNCRLKFWGVRGSIPAPGPSTAFIGGNTSCIEVRADGEIIVLDAGTGIRLLGRSLAEEFQGSPLNLSLLISHTHWDHIQGFPFFAPAYQKQNHLRIIGAEESGRHLAAILEAQMHSAYFPIAMEQLPGNVVFEDLQKGGFSVGPIRVRAFRCNHPGMTVGYRLDTSAGSIAYIPDNESFHHPHQSEEPPEVREAAFLEFIHGVDILLLDSQYEESEFPEHRGWGHGCLEEVVELAIKAEARRLFLFHHDPDHDDARIASFVQTAWRIANEAGSPIIIDAAREGMEVPIGSDAE